MTKELVEAWQTGAIASGFSVPELESMISYLSERYDFGEPVVDDATFDALERVLQQTCPHSPVLQKVGATAQLGVKVQHDPPMLSQEKALTPDAIDSFLNRYVSTDSVVISEKLDGAALALRYEIEEQEGPKPFFKLASASTRGDGFFGEDVTANALLMSSIPRGFWADSSSEWIEIRGEVVISRRDFEAINVENVERGMEPFSNPRNLAAGTLRLSDYEEVKRRQLQFVAYEYLTDLDWSDSTVWYARRLTYLNELGFETVLHEVVDLRKENILRIYNKGLSERSVVGGRGRSENEKYDCDG